ncbi:uncharacterized protein KGF55_002154 [Candida pseudojiufengensis]|uniref:uncharacterized protein n=1 Tax=Candida pseudojiufengensis TaxID=497109 RepID=UPI002224FC32|nr:uncharacterized protein KGF55_002154 [Candida pseudojiufengensis]KAI5964212.1 hypothetical protein KGF55_002154 [Candida pseudojiufengensis]
MEIDDYINSNFTTIDDLTNIDTKLNQLNDISTQINQIATNKLSSSDNNEVNSETLHVEEPSIDENEVENAINDLELQLKEISESNDLSTSIIKLEELIKEYGSFPGFIILKNQLQKKIEIQKQLQHLSQVSELEKQLISLNLSVKEITEINDKSQELNDTYLNTLIDDQINNTKTNLQNNLKQIITKNKWLVNDTVSNSDLTTITNLFDELIQLQSIKNIPEYPNTWWGLETLLEPIIIRFNYHFDTPQKDTNKISKPEWCLQYIETFLDDNLSLINIIIDKSFKSLNKIGTYEIITCLLIPIRNKINKMISIINSNINKVNDDNNDIIEKYGRLLTHLIYELSTFDQRLRNKYKYNPNVTDFNVKTDLKWIGITGDIFLNNQNNAFDNWLNFENKLAIKRFEKEIINKEDSFKVDFDYHSTSHTQLLKPTYSSYGFIKLINNLNNHLQQIRVFKYNMKYIAKIQLSLLDLYLNEINNQFKTITDKLNMKNVLNIIPGGITDDKNSRPSSNSENDSIKNLENLLEIYVSIKYVINSLEEWSEELIFVQLWDIYKSLNRETKLNEVMDYYYNNNSNDAEGEIDGIFGSITLKYDKLLNKSINQINSLFINEIKKFLKKYVNSSQWDLEFITGDKLEPSNDLNQLINNLPNYLDLLAKSISKIDYFQFTTLILNIICDTLYEYVITNNKFSKIGINQLIIDFNYLIQSLQYQLLLNTTKNRRSSTTSTSEVIEEEFSNDFNQKYIKVVQSIDLLDSLVEIPIRKPIDVQKLRSNYNHELNELSDYEIKDLINRIK